MRSKSGINRDVNPRTRARSRVQGWSAARREQPLRRRPETTRRARYTAAILAVTLFPTIAAAQTNTPSVFAVPAVLAHHAKLKQEAALAIRDKQYGEAVRIATEAIAAVAFDPQIYYLLGQAQAELDDKDAAFKSLEKAFRLGVNSPEAIRRDPHLSNLVEDIRFNRLLKVPRDARRTEHLWKWQPKATALKDRRAVVSATNTGWSTKLGCFATLFKPPAAPFDDTPVRGNGQVGRRIRGWYAEGSASGHHGVCYDNFDRGHSLLDTSQFPQLARIVYDAEVKRFGFNSGLQNRFLHRGVVVIGNSSTAVTDPRMWRSQPRLAYCTPQAIQMLSAQFATNQLYFYPEHRDHDPGHNGDGGGYGDVFPANTPYVLISQGSSYSDKPLMHAVACTMAAFRPTTKKFLIRHGALMPTLQMILRRCYSGIGADTDYLTGAAHPSVFDGKLVDVARMIELAHRIDRGTEPPVVNIRALSEDPSRLGRDYFHWASSERLFDTPWAIARVFRTTNRQKRIQLTAEGSRDLNGLPITYHWVVLRGDKSRISILPTNPDGSAVEVDVDWHPRRSLSPDSKMESNRVDIGAFVHNGKFFSAPAFLTYFFLDNEKRVYSNSGQIASVDYSTDNYVDPMIGAAKSWRDEYRYDDQQTLLGWSRKRVGRPAEQFSADGARVESRDSLGRPLTAQQVKYIVKQVGGDSWLDYEQVGQILQYHYESDTDFRGHVTVRQAE